MVKGVRGIPVKERKKDKDWMMAVGMKMQGRNILMLIDNCSAHPEFEMSNVKLVFCFPTQQKKMQPCDAGIIQNLKQLYRKRMMRSILMNMDNRTRLEAYSAGRNIVVEKCVGHGELHDHPEMFQKCGIYNSAVD